MHPGLDAGIPSRHLWSTFASFVPRRLEEFDALARGVHWAKSNDGSEDFCITGTAGTGKTHLLAAAIAARLEAGDASARFVDVPTLTAWVNQASADDVQTYVDELCGASALAMDDIGQCGAGRWGAEIVKVVLEWRRLADKPTIVSSPLGGDTFHDLGYCTLEEELGLMNYACLQRPTAQSND